jgi:hypothetical protein
MQRLRPAIALAALLASAAACSGGGGAAGPAAEVPSSGGTVLVMDGGTRTTAPAALLGFVYGLHTIVLDGDRIFAGMSRLETTEAAGGGHVITLSDGLTAQLVPAGDGFELRFSTGEAIALHRQHRATE